MRAVSVVLVIACAFALAMVSAEAEMEHDQHLLVAASASRLRRKIARAQRVLSHLRTVTEGEAEAEAEVSTGVRSPASGRVEAAIGASFVIGDVGSGGTRLFVYSIVNDAAKLIVEDPCAKETQKDPTNMDLIFANTDPAAKGKAIAKHLLDTCVDTVKGEKTGKYNVLGLTTDEEVKAWMAAVPMYYEATAGLRLTAQQLARDGSSIEAGVWKHFRDGDTAWRTAAKTAIVDGDTKNVVNSGERKIFLTRVIPGALEGWYGFRAGAVKAGAVDKCYGAPVGLEKLIYIEVGGASQQIVFTIPQVTIGDGTNKPVLPLALAELDAESEVEMTTVAESETDAEAEEQLMSRLSSGAGAVINAEADMSIMSTAAGPMHLKLTSKQPETPLLYSKSFLGNGMNRFTNAILHRVVDLKFRSNTECSKRTTKPCLDMPCWRREAVLTRSPSKGFAWETSFCGGVNSGDCPDAKVLQDAEDEVTSAWIAPAYEKDTVRWIMGTDDIDKCIALARDVWAGDDEHEKPYPYKQQLLEVRAALKAATELDGGSNKKTHVMVSTLALAAAPKGQNNDHPKAMSMGDFRSYMRFVLNRRAMGPFTYHTPMLAAYFDTLMFDDETKPGGGFGLGTFCADCKYGAWGVSWTVGAADFFVAYAKAHEHKRKEYSKWTFQAIKDRVAPSPYPDLEDPTFQICSEAFDHKTFAGKRSAAAALCEKTWQNGAKCVLKVGRIPWGNVENDCVAYDDNTNNLNDIKHCSCVPA